MIQKMIICVDDEKMILDTLRDQLIGYFGQKYIYETAESGMEALEIIDDAMKEEVEIAVVITDWLMPGMKGDELLLRIHEKNPDIRSIMLSGQADDTAVERTRMNTNMRCYLAKPWVREDLVARIEDRQDLE